MYDDHMYCETCGLHAVGCWCYESRPPKLRAEDLAEDGDRVCYQATRDNEWDHPK